MKKILFTLALIFSFVLVGQAVAGWTITTNWTGKWSASITFETTTASNSSETNFILSKGFIIGKRVPTMVWSVSKTNDELIGVTNNISVLAIKAFSATNIRVKAYFKNPGQKYFPHYNAWKVFMLYLRPGQK
jgi:hypothetical protein